MLRSRCLGFKAADFYAIGCTVKELHQTKLTISQLRVGGYTASDCKGASCHTAEKLRDGGYTCVQLREALYTVAECKEAGFSLVQLRDGGCPASELRAIGYAAAEMRAAGFAIRELRCVRQLQRGRRA